MKFFKNPFKKVTPVKELAVPSALWFNHDDPNVIIAMGKESKPYDTFLDILMKKMLEAEAMEDAGLVEAIKTEVLEDVLNSQEFKNLGIELKSPNDFFLIGYLFLQAVFTVNARRSMVYNQSPKFRQYLQNKIAKC